MKCSNCGAEWNEGEKFCAVCGQPVNAEQSGNTVKPVNTGQTGSVTQPAAGQSVGQMTGSGQDSGKKKGLSILVLP